MSTERLLSIFESSKRLGISPRSFHRHKASLVAKGLQSVRAGRRILFREASVNKVSAAAAEHEEALFGGGNG